MNSKQFGSSLTDRLLSAFGNAVIALPTATLLWLALNGLPWSAVAWLSGSFIIWFTGIMALLGFVFRDVVLLSLYSRCWRFLLHWFSGGH